jgi:hypothetical protein
MKAYTYDYDAAEVIEVEVEELRYPFKDSRGETIYVNTHFATREKAREALRREIEAGLQYAARDRARAAAALANATEELANVGARLAKVLEGERREKEGEP